MAPEVLYHSMEQDVNNISGQLRKRRAEEFTRGESGQKKVPAGEKGGQFLQTGTVQRPRRSMA